MGQCAAAEGDKKGDASLGAQAEEPSANGEQCDTTEQPPAPRPTGQDMKNAVLLDVRFTLDYTQEGGPQSAEEYKALLSNEGGTSAYAAIDGLRSKYFTLTENGEHGNGIYVFLTREQAEAYKASDLFTTFKKQPYYAAVEVTEYEILQGTEECLDNTPWGSGAAATRDDVQKAALLYARFNPKYDTGAEGSPVSQENYCAAGKAGNFRGWVYVAGLQSVYLTFNAQQNIAGAVHVFLNQEALDNYIASDLYKTMVDSAHMKDQMVEGPANYGLIAGTELTLEKSAWPSASDDANDARVQGQLKRGCGAGYGCGF